MTQIDLTATAPARFATRLAFFAAGFSTACCAPLFPFFKDNVGANEATFGLLLFCLGLGSVTAMPTTGIVAARHGARPVILVGGFGLVFMLPVLALAQAPVWLGVGLFLFGAALGSLDVAMNIHGAEVERREARPLMSDFHAQFSIGGLLGAALITALLTLGLATVLAAVIGSIISCVAMGLTWTRLLRVSGQSPEPFVLPRGIVLLLACLAAIMFLVEGAILDWGALLLIERNLAPAQTAGAGYILFSLAMVVGRLSGRYTIARFGAYRILFVGGLLTASGFGAVLLAPGLGVAIVGFLLIGLGAANLVPILFSVAGQQKDMPMGLAVAAVTTTGYAGMLLGPAMIGFVAQAISLPGAIWMLVPLILLVSLTAHLVARQ